MSIYDTILGSFFGVLNYVSLSPHTHTMGLTNECGGACVTQGFFGRASNSGDHCRWGLQSATVCATGSNGLFGGLSHSFCARLMGVWARIMTLVAPELVRNNSFFSVPLRPSRVRLVERKKKVHFWYGLTEVGGGSGSSSRGTSPRVWNRARAAQIID